jgi:DNA-binding Lrp family transcriptional regulator
MSKLQIEKLNHYFKERSVFDTTDIAEFYLRTERDLNPTTINWRIHKLVQSGILKRLGRGTFSLGEEKKFYPEISTTIQSLFKKLKKEFSYTNFCIWNTSTINEFMQHQPVRFFILVEVEKGMINSVYYFLKEIKKVVYIEPTSDMFEKYIVYENNVIILTPIVSEAPTQKVNNVVTITIEKMLVDIYCDEVTFMAQQGAEMRTIFTEAFSKYTINRSKLLRYAARRGKNAELSTYLESIPNYWQ